jgi:hypothetical protein
LKKELATKEKAAADAAAETRKLKVQVIAQANGFRPDAAALWLGTQQLSDESDDGIKAALAGAPDWVKATTGTTTPPNNPTRQQTTLTKETLKSLWIKSWRRAEALSNVNCQFYSPSVERQAPEGTG